MRTRGSAFFGVGIVLMIIALLFIVAMIAIDSPKSANADTSITQVSDNVRVRTYGNGVWLMEGTPGQGFVRDGDYARALAKFRAERPALKILSVTYIEVNNSILIITKEQ